MDLETFKLLQEADWGEIGYKLLAFAEWWAGNYTWRHATDLLAQGKTLEDVVQEVIVKTLSGDRKWDPDKGPLVPWLKDQLKSVIDALARSASHRYEVRIPEGKDEERASNGVEFRASQVGNITPVGPPDPEKAMLEKEAEEQTRQRVDALFQAVDGEPELVEVLETIVNGCEPKPRYLAAEIGAPVEDIYNRVKRLRRRAVKLMKGENA